MSKVQGDFKILKYIVLKIEILKCRRRRSEAGYGRLLYVAKNIILHNLFHKDVTTRLSLTRTRPF